MEEFRKCTTKELERALDDEDIPLSYYQPIYLVLKERKPEVEDWL
jgi:hypothetical protein